VVGHGPLADDVFRVALAAGALDVVELPAADAWLVELLTDAVDLDPLGPGVDRVVGLDAGTGVRWDGLITSRGRLGSRSLRAALPDQRGLAVLTWGAGPPVTLDAVVVREVLSAAQRGNDVVVVDLPRVMDDVAAEVVTRCDEVLVVTDPTVAGVAAAGRVVASLRPSTQRLSLVVRGGRAALPTRDVGAALGLPVAVEVGHQRRLGEHLDLGLGPVHSRRSPLARAARAALARTGWADDTASGGGAASAGRAVVPA
jgi:secretion/DNA translocation related CpaE-like protein